jgi:hypothetical protein
LDYFVRITLFTLGIYYLVVHSTRITYNPPQGGFFVCTGYYLWYKYIVGWVKRQRNPTLSKLSNILLGLFAST